MGYGLPEVATTRLWEEQTTLHNQDAFHIKVTQK